jgi:putative tricarboxylic transport membrane protein
MAGLFGLLVGTVGFSDRGDIRGTMGIDYLLDGVPDLAALMGLFCAAEMFKLVRSDFVVAKAEARKVSLRRILKGCRMAFDYPAALIRGSLIGVGIGVVPGVGSSVANLIAYSEARRTAKDSSSFGKGNPNGVVASEAANSSSEGGSMATLLALGIPGGGATAVMLGVFAMHNVTGGPRFMSDHKDIVYAIIFANFFQTIALMLVGIGFLYVSSAIVKVPVRILVPTVLAVAVFGCYASVGNMSGPATFVVFALLGWGMTRFGYPVAATVVGLLLAKLTEGELLRTFQLSGGELSFLLERPIALVFTLLLVCSLFLPLLIKRMRRNTPGGQLIED